MTASTDDPARAVVASREVQVTSAFGVRRTERTRPVGTVLTHAERIRTVPPASSREEYGITIGFTGYQKTVVSTLGCPSPLAFLAEFVKLCICWHAPSSAPVLTGGVMTTGWGDTCLTPYFVVGAPTVAIIVKAVKAVAPVVT